MDDGSALTSGPEVQAGRAGDGSSRVGPLESHVQPGATWGPGGLDPSGAQQAPFPTQQENHPSMGH